VLNKTYHDCCLQPQPKQDEIGALQSMLLFNYTIPRPSIIVGDRGFESYNLFAHLRKAEGMEFIIRVKQEKTAMKLIRDLPMRELDVDVSGEITTRRTKEDKEKGGISSRLTQIQTVHTAATPAQGGRIFQVHTRSAFALSGFS